MASVEAEDWRVGLSLLQRQRYMLEGQYGADVKFVVGDSKQTIMAHRFVLVCASAVFEAMLERRSLVQPNPITLLDDEAAAFREMMRFIYYEEVTISNQNATALFRIANKYHVTQLSRKCAGFLEDTLTSDTVCTILEKGISYSEDALIKACISFVNDHTPAILNSPHFVKISNKALLEIIKSDKLKGLKEVDIFDACKHWADARCVAEGKMVNDANRRSALGEVLFHIRFPLMTAVEFASATHTSSLLTASERADILGHISLHSNESNTCDCKMAFTIRPRSIPVARPNVRVPAAPRTGGFNFAPRTSGVASGPRTSEVPAVTRTSEVPAAPRTSWIASAPRTSEVASAPRTSEVASPPRTSGVPVVARTSGVASAPRTSEVASAPRTSGVPAAPRTSGVPAAPRTSGVPAAPRTSGVPAAPRTSGVPAAPRTNGVPSAQRPLRRFQTPVNVHRFLSTSAHTLPTRTESIDIVCSKAAVLVAVGVYGGESGCHHNARLRLLDSKLFILSDTEVVPVRSDGNESTVCIDLPSPVELAAGARYTIQVAMSGPSTYIGVQGVPEIYAGNFTVHFHTSSQSSRFTTRDQGQIPELYFIV